MKINATAGNTPRTNYFQEGCWRGFEEGESARYNETKVPR